MKPPVMLYDDKCRLCLGFARTVNRLAGGRLTIIGHYTPEGRRLRDAYLYPDATGMFWILGERQAHGGRAALPQLLRRIITARGGSGMQHTGESCGHGSCEVMARSASLMTHSDRIEYGARRATL